MESEPYGVLYWSNGSRRGNGGWRIMEGAGCRCPFLGNRLPLIESASLDFGGQNRYRIRQGFLQFRWLHQI
ncbi:hypothetical protein VTK73DRAFT_7078 [Phialemonium thermophilum]|uniref:Uncharacterized protein n=1 Tax=Phialemonium thermophilum TaxID=223376 RepID=A0ABR3XTM6_9PEZI